MNDQELQELIETRRGLQRQMDAENVCLAEHGRFRELACIVDRKIDILENRDARYRTEEVPPKKTPEELARDAFHDENERIARVLLRRGVDWYNGSDTACKLTFLVHAAKCYGVGDYGEVTDFVEWVHLTLAQPRTIPNLEPFEYIPEEENHGN